MTRRLTNLSAAPSFNPGWRNPALGEAARRSLVLSAPWVTAALRYSPASGGLCWPPPGELAGGRRSRACAPPCEPSPGEPPAAHLRFHPLIPPREYQAFAPARPPPKPGAEDKIRRTAARLLPPPTATPTRNPALLFPATIPPGRRGVAQSGRAPGSGSGGRRFKSCRPDAARPPDGFRPRGGHGIWLAASDASFAPFPIPGSGAHFGTHRWTKTCIFRRSCRRPFVPVSTHFIALAS